ncbi:MAG: hypothetical protein A4S09_01215 [Proteobacteria bacterium SG_bin7]|nr:MAG: hypothetical protein A4S09_01215 [Proteobacteria bacterium SG_bin7]
MSNERGFTFIEILILSSVLLFVFVGTGQTLDYLVKSNRHQSLLWDAGELGELVTLELLNMYSSSPELTEGNHVRYYDSQKLQTQGPTFFEVNWTITDNKPILSVKEIQLTVKWREGALDRTTAYITYR